jgi:hypothetical protein
VSRRHYDPVTPGRLVRLLAHVLVGAGPSGHALRVAIDGPRCADPHGLAQALAVPIAELGRPVICARADAFWRDAALRLERGRTDVAAFGSEWLDTGAVRRELLQPLGPDGDGEYLTALRDPQTNRSIRIPRQPAAPRSILLFSGELLLGRELPFDLSIHLAVTPAARARRTPDEWAWTLPAFDRYDEVVKPIEIADIVIRYDDPNHPALSHTQSA